MFGISTDKKMCLCGSFLYSLQKSQNDVVKLNSESYISQLYVVYELQ